jgi:eukaryotic-like serine/threonine-protein kinase
MKILAVDDCENILNYIEICLTSEISDAEVTLYDSLRRGKPDRDFHWDAYDVLLLDYNLGNNQTGVGWLEEFREQPGFPKTVLVTATTNPAVVSDAIRAGADSYLNKSELTPERLAAVVREIISPPITELPRAANGSNTRFQERFTTTPKSRSPDASPAPDLSGAYRFGHLMASGSLSDIYLAERESDGLTVVIKTLDRSSEAVSEATQRFLLEGQLLRGLSSPYVAKVYEHGVTNSYHYIAMEFFSRGDLKQRIENGVRAEDALIYASNIACGLQAIHEAGIVHRDLKPANVMFRSDDSMGLADFGISKDLGRSLGLTMEGSILGSIHYLSPEQARGLPADPRSDLYSLGVTFYEMLTGTRPYLGERISAIIFQHLHADIPVLGPEHEAAQLLLNHLMAKDPADRYQNAGEVIDELSSLYSMGVFA